ncbi:hypothetical protein B0H17DRAFT_1139976 [Mycena rosella]|uniref:Uncharacterized protein n=1 Tax=Mycena rosella TaxID=1033263 RepID=A0AAD7D3D6_MYCRO|nr:hypothetical protein B0H17DRAFT_1139976 [Mycena rosella]
MAGQFGGGGLLTCGEYGSMRERAPAAYWRAEGTGRPAARRGTGRAAGTGRTARRGTGRAAGTGRTAARRGTGRAAGTGRAVVTGRTAARRGTGRVAGTGRAVGTGRTVARRGTGRTVARRGTGRAAGTRRAERRTRTAARRAARRAAGTGRAAARRRGAGPELASSTAIAGDDGGWAGDGCIVEGGVGGGGCTGNGWCTAEGGVGGDGDGWIVVCVRWGSCIHDDGGNGKTNLSHETVMRRFWMPIIHCCTSAIREACTLYRALNISDPAANPALDDKRLCTSICKLDLLSMEDRFIELKVWACTMQALIKFLARSYVYAEELARRCSVWDQSYVLGIVCRHKISSLLQDLRAPAADVHDRLFSDADAAIPTLDTTSAVSSTGSDETDDFQFTPDGVITSPTNTQLYRLSTQSDGTLAIGNISKSYRFHSTLGCGGGLGNISSFLLLESGCSAFPPQIFDHDVMRCQCAVEHLAIAVQDVRERLGRSRTWPVEKQSNGRSAGPASEERGTSMDHFPPTRLADYGGKDASVLEKKPRLRRGGRSSHHVLLSPATRHKAMLNIPEFSTPSPGSPFFAADPEGRIGKREAEKGSEVPAPPKRSARRLKTLAGTTNLGRDRCEVGRPALTVHSVAPKTCWQERIQLHENEDRAQNVVPYSPCSNSGADVRIKLLARREVAPKLTEGRRRDGKPRDECLGLPVAVKDSEM